MGGLACHHVEKARPTLISEHGKNTFNIRDRMAHPTLTSDHGRPNLPPCQKGPTLTSDHGGLTCYYVRKSQHLHLNMGGPSCHHVRMALHLHLTMEGTNPTMSERLLDSSPLLEETLIWRTPRFSLKYSNFTLANGLVNTSTYLFVHCNILELHCSPLYHIPDIVVLDLNMLRLVMEHWVL